MATSQDTKVKIVDIQVKYQEAVDAMAKYRAAIDEARAQMKALKKDLKDGKITQAEYDRQSEASRVFMKQQGDAINTLSRQVQNQIKVQKENEGSLKQLRAELSNATAAYDAMSRAERESAKGQELKNHIVQITNELKGAEEGTLRFYRNVGNYPTSVTTALGSIKSKFMEVGSTIAGIVTGGGIMAFGQKIIQVGRDFNDGMARVHAVTQAGADDMKMMSDEAKRLGATTAYTAAESAGALENLTRNGLNAAQATNALSPTLQFAQANTIGLAEAADIMTNVSNGFNMGVEGMAHVSDSLSYTASHSATNVSQLAEALKNAAPFGHALGQPIEEVNSALGVLADVGIKGSDAGSALRMVMLGLATSTAKQQKVFEKYGISIDQQSLKTDGLTKTLEKLRDSGIMSSASSANDLADVFGRRVSPQAMALLNNIDALQTKLGGLQEAQGTTGDMFEVSMSTVTQEIKGLQSAWEAFLLSIYDSNSDALVAPLQALRELVNFVREHFGDIAQIIASVIAGISFAKLINGAVSAFTQMKNSAVGNAQAATQQVQVCQNNEIALRKQTASLTKQLESANAIERERIETQLVAKKRELANAEKMTQKAKTAEITLWERAAALETGSAWTKAFTIAKVGVTSFVATARAAFKGFILTAVLSLAFDLLMKLYSKLSEGKGVWANLKTYATSAFRAIANAIIWVMNKCIDLYNKIALVRLPIQLVALQFKNLWEGVKLVFNLIVDGVKSVGRSLSGLGKIIKGVATFSWSDIKAGVKDIMSNFGKTIQEGLGDFKKFGRNVADNVLDAYNKTLTQGAVAHIKPIADDPIPVKTKAKPKASVNTPTETTDGNGTTPDANGDGNGKGDGKKTTKITKEDRARAKAAQEEAKLVAEAEKAMLDLLGECAEKRKALLENQYNGEINKLKAKLATDKTLTENSKEAIRQIIVAKEKKLQEELDKLDDDNIKRQISEQQKQIESRLSIVKKGSEEELNLKLEQNRKKADLDILALKQEEDAAQKGAATALMYRQQVLAELEQSGTATEEQLAQATASVEYAQSEITRISSDYAERRANRLEQSWQQEDQLRQAHNQFMLEQRQLALQNEMTMVDTFVNEEMNRIIGGQTQEQYLQENGIEMVSDLEMRKLQIQQEMAEQRLQFIRDQGQLETETREQYLQRLRQAEQAQSDAQIAIDRANLKNKQAYVKSMKSLGDSLIDLLATIGEHDKNAARLSKILALFKIAVNTGVAISEGIKAATALGWPAMIPAIVTTTATVLTNMATAVSSVNSAKENFAEGGKVHGPGTGTSDSVPANLSNGEFVMTAKATKIFEPLLTVMNSIGAGVPISMNGAYERVESAESLTDSFAEAAREIKPIVSVVEITEAQERVKMIENLDNF